MKRSNTPSFIQEFELIEPRLGGFRTIDQVEGASSRLFNAVLGVLVKRVKRVKSSKEWIEARKLPKGIARTEAFQAILIREGLTENHVDTLVKELRVGELKELVGSHVAQKIGIRAWSAISKLISAQAKRVRFKSKGQFFSFEGKDNKSFLRLIQPETGSPFIQLRSSSFSLKLNPNCSYQKHALSSRCKFVRILKRKIRGKIRYFAQLICEGLPYQDIEKAFRHEEKMKEFFQEQDESCPGILRETKVDPKYQNVACLDFGPKKVAISTATHAFERNICEGLLSLSKEIRQMQRALDRSLRAMNPQNYQEDGTIKKGKKKWHRSKKYLQLQNQLANLYRKQAAHRKSIQGNLSNDVLAIATYIKLEKVSYKGFQKNFGKSVGLNAPSNLQGMLTRKAANARGKVELIQTFDTKLSQTCLCGSQKKKPLHQRVHECENCGLGLNGSPIGRDLFSAFLGVFTDNQETRKGRTLQYKSQLNLEQARLAIQGHRTLSSAGQSYIHQIQIPGESSPGRVEKSTLEDSAGTAKSLFLESKGTQYSFGMRKKMEVEESPSYKI